jgi:arylsulfatase
LTRRSIDFLKKKEKSQPFFLHLAYSSPHWPLHAKPSDIAKYRGKYDLGWDSLRTLRHQKQLQMGLVNINQPPAKDPSLPLWSSLTYDEKQYWVKKMEVYAAMVDNLDQNIGQLIQYLRETQQLDNTLILFVSDNGAEGWDFAKLPMAALRNTGPVGTIGSNESYTKNWSQLSNVPFKSYKATPYEGGLSSPFIARWPAAIPANTLKEGNVHFVDFMPTLLDLAQISYPKTYKDIRPNPLAGESFAELLKGKEWTRKTPIFYEWAGQRMVRQGQWKLLSYYPQNQWELYNIENDRPEHFNVAQKHPDIVAELSAAYLTWAKQNEVVDWHEAWARKVTFPTDNR